jgi:hypothetical protein
MELALVVFYQAQLIGLIDDCPPTPTPQQNMELEYIMPLAGWHRVRKDRILMHVVYGELMSRNRNQSVFMSEWYKSHPTAAAALGKDSFRPRLWTVSDADKWQRPALD